MTYDASERSYQSGAPVELYEFGRASQVWRYNSSNDTVTIDGLTYTAASIRRSGIEATQERARSAIKLYTPRNFEIADLFRITPPTDVISLTIKRYHRGDESVVVIWSGRVVNCDWSGSEAAINCEPVSTSMRRTGLRRIYQRQCPHVLYGDACALQKDDYKVTGAVDAISGNTISVSECGAEADNYFAGGFVELSVGSGGIERRFITANTGAVLTLSKAFGSDLEVGASVNVYPGCDHTLNTCKNKFSNLVNYGGFPFIPTKNPFDGSPVY